MDRNDDKLLRLPQAVEYLGGLTTLAGLRDMVWRRKLTTVRIGRRVAVWRSELDRLIQEGTTPAIEQR